MASRAATLPGAAAAAGCCAACAEGRSLAPGGTARAWSCTCSLRHGAMQTGAAASSRGAVAPPEARPKRLAADAAAAAILHLAHALTASSTSSFPLHNYPPPATANGAKLRAAPNGSYERVRRPLQQQHPAAQGLLGLQENCTALGVQVGQARFGGPSAGVSLYAARSIRSGDAIGYLWGVVLESVERWAAMRDATPQTAAQFAAEALAAGEEDYWTPPQHGIFRCMAVPLQDGRLGGDHLLASEQCPMAYVNEAPAAAANVAIRFPRTAFTFGTPDAYMHVAFVATRQIAAGEELLVQYEWAPEQLELAAQRYNRHRKELAQRAFAQLTPFEQLRAQDARFAGFTVATAASMCMAGGTAAHSPVGQLPSFVTTALDGCMNAFHTPRFGLWVPSAEDPMAQLCSRWLAVAVADVQANWAALDLQHDIRNGGEQTLIRPAHPLFSDTETAMRKALDIFTGPRVGAKLHLAGLVLLTMKPGDGPMPYHADQPCTPAQQREHARRCWSVLLYVGDCQATALPRLTEEQLDQVVDANSSHSVVASLLQPQNFFAGRARGGSILVMRSDLAHTSPKHVGANNRHALYALFSPSPGEGQMLNSHFPLGVPG